MSFDLHSLLNRCKYGPPLSSQEREPISTLREQSAVSISALEDEITTLELQHRLLPDHRRYSTFVAVTSDRLEDEQRVKQIVGLKKQLLPIQRRQECCDSLLLGPSPANCFSVELLCEIFS